MESENQDAFAELDSQIQPRASSSSGVLDISRPPSYNAVSNASLSGEESARRARELFNTDVKSLISSGNRPSIDDTEIKRLEADEYESAREFVEDGDDANSVYFDAPGASNDLMRAIEELQRQQETLKSLHKEHDSKLQDLLRLQPSVNEQFKIIRKHSRTNLRGKNSIPETDKTAISASNDINASNIDNDHKKDKDTKCCSNGEGSCGARARSSDEDDTNNNKCDTQGKNNNVSRSSNGSVPPNDQVIHRKPSGRNENALCAFQQLLFSEEQHRVYIQLEKLYSNFHRLHLPSKTVQTLMEGNLLGNPVDPTGNLMRGPQLAAGEANTDNERWKQEEKRISRENKDLKEKNEELQRKVEEIKSQMEVVTNRRIPPPIPPKPDFRPYSSNRRRAIKNYVKPTTSESAQLNFVSGRPTSPMSHHARPLDIDIREISIQHKIESYSQKLHQEKLQEGRKQVSSSFYIAHGGCRAQLEVFLNGNGTGRGRCMSLFLRVVPGAYDDSISWPVTLHIRATLMNQSRGLSHSVEDKGNQFQFSKPRTCSDGDNDCWGLVEFVNHKMIAQPGFIKDDAIVLRCKIVINSSWS